jgi:hypothetical protein
MQNLMLILSKKFGYKNIRRSPMTHAATILSLNEFLALPDGEIACELINGQAIPIFLSLTAEAIFREAGLFSERT